MDEQYGINEGNLLCVCVQTFPRDLWVNESSSLNADIVKAQQLWTSPSEGLKRRTGIFCGLSVLWVSFDEEGIREWSISLGLTWPSRCYILPFSCSAFMLPLRFSNLVSDIPSVARIPSPTQLCLYHALTLPCITMETETISALKVLCWILWNVCPSYIHTLQTKYSQMCKLLIARSENEKARAYNTF